MERGGEHVGVDWSGVEVSLLCFFRSLNYNPSTRFACGALSYGCELGGRLAIIIWASVTNIRNDLLHQIRYAQQIAGGAPLPISVSHQTARIQGE